MAYILDGMAFLQSLDENQFQTFDDLACTVLHKICMLLTGSLKIASVTLVFDQYDNENSIEMMEREWCTSREAGPKYAIQGGRQVHNYQKFLRNSTNKAALAEFLCNYLTEKAPSILKDG